MEDVISDPTRAARGFVTLVAEYVVPVLFDIVRVAHQRFSRPFVVFLCDILPLQCTVGLFFFDDGDEKTILVVRST